MSKRKSEAITGEAIPASTLDGHLWSSIFEYLEPDELQNMRLAGSKDLVFHDPLFTSHLPLRMDLATFFRENKDETRASLRIIKRWLYNRKSLVIGSRVAHIHPGRVASMIKLGFMNSVEEIVVLNCAFHRKVIAELIKLPNLTAIKLDDELPSVCLMQKKGRYHEAVLRETTGIVNSLKNLTKLEVLDIELDCTVMGRHLSVLQDMKNLRSLSLRGFDLSEGIEHIHSLTELENLHLCHGNTCQAIESRVPVDAFLALNDLKKLKTIYVEAMDCMTHEQIKPLCQFGKATSLTFKHCQEISGETLSSISNMTSLQALHFVNCATDECEPWESEHLVHLQNLKGLKTLSLMFVMLDHFDILDLEGLDELETLNIGLHDIMSKKEFDILCLTILPILPALKHLRIFFTEKESMSNLVGAIFEDRPEYKNADTLRCGQWQIDFKVFDVGTYPEID